MPKFLSWCVWLLAAACAPMVNSTALGPAHPPRSSESEILLFSVRIPECPFEEIGLLTVERAPGPFVSAKGALRAIKNRAGEMGGDAVIGLSQLAVTEGFNGGLAGTVVRFDEETCRR